MAKVELTLEEQIAALQQTVSEQNSQLKENDRTIKEQSGQLVSQGKELATAASKLSQTQTKLDTTQKQLDATNGKLTESQSAVGKHVEAIRILTQEKEASEAIVAGYEAKLRVAEATGDGTVVVSHNDQAYRVVVPQFHHEGQIVKAEALKSDASLVAKLVEAGSGILEAVKA